MTRYVTIAALAAFACATSAAAQTTAPATVDHSSPNERPILVFGAIRQAPQADDHGLAQERPIYVFGAIKDRRAPAAQADPADRAVPALPVVYEAPTHR